MSTPPTPPPLDYLAQAYEALNNDHFPAFEVEKAAVAQAFATIGILQQLTRIADLVAAEIQRDRDCEVLAEERMRNLRDQPMRAR